MAIPTVIDGDLYQPRTTLLDHMAAKLQTLSHVCLTGPPGFGKSQLALKYQQIHLHEYIHSWFIHADTVDNDISAIFSQLNLPVDDVEMSLESRIEQLHAQLLKEESWLILIDGFVTLNDVQDLQCAGLFSLYSAGRMHHTITTLLANEQETEPDGPNLEVSAFDQAESIALVRRRFPDEPVHDIKLLCDLVSHHPLGLQHAMLAVVSSGKNMKDFVNHVRKTGSLGQVRVDDIPGNYQKDFFQLYRQSLLMLQSDSPLAFTLVSYLNAAQVHHLKVHVTLLNRLRWLLTYGPEDIAYALAIGINYGIFTLANSSFASVTPMVKLFAASAPQTVEPCMAEWIFALRDIVEAPQIKFTLDTHLQFVSAIPPLSFFSSVFSTLIFPHLMTMNQEAASSPNHVPFGERESVEYMWILFFAEIAQLVSHTLHSFGNVLHRASQELAIYSESIHSVMFSKSSEPYLNSVLTIARKSSLDELPVIQDRLASVDSIISGNPTPSRMFTILTQSILGYKLRGEGRLEESISKLKDVWKLQILIDGEESVTAMVLLFDVACMYGHLRNFPESWALFEKVLQFRLKYHGDVHPDVALVFEAMGTTKSALIDFDSALTLYQHALRIQEQCFGANHFVLSHQLFNIGLTFQAKLDYTSAISHFEKVFSIQKSYFGPIDPQNFDVVQRIGNLHHKLGNFREALIWYQEAFLISDAAIKKGGSIEFKHFVAYSAAAVAAIQMEEGSIDKSVKMFNTSLSLHRQLYDRSDPRLARFLFQFASAQILNRSYTSALGLFQESIAYQQIIFPEKTLMNAISYFGIGCCQLGLNIPKSAINSFREALNIHRKFSVEYEIARTHSWIGQCELQLGSLDEAVKSCEEAVRLFNGLSMDQGMHYDHKVAYYMYDAMVETYKCAIDSPSSKHNVFLKKHSEIFKSKIVQLRRDIELSHPKSESIVQAECMGLTFFRLGDAYSRMEKFDEAVDVLRKGLVYFKDTPGVTLTFFIELLTLLAQVYKKQHEYFLAIEPMEEAYSLAQKYYGTQINEELANCMLQLSYCRADVGKVSEAFKVRQGALLIFEKIESAPPNRDRKLLPEALFSQGQYLFHAKESLYNAFTKFVRALPALTSEFSKSHPYTIHARLYIAELCADWKRYEVVLDMAEIIEEIISNPNTFPRLLCDMNRQRPDFCDFVTTIQASNKGKPDSKFITKKQDEILALTSYADVAYKLALILRSCELFEDAIRVITTAIRLQARIQNNFNNQSLFIILLASILTEAGQYQAAIESLTKARDLANQVRPPDVRLVVETYYLSGRANTLLGRIQPAISDLSIALELSSQLGLDRYMLQFRLQACAQQATVLDFVKNYREAEEYHRLCIDLQRVLFGENSLEIGLGLARFSRSLFHYNLVESLEHAKEALEIMSSSHRYDQCLGLLYQMGLTLYGLNDYATALVLFQKCIDIGIKLYGPHDFRVTMSRLRLGLSHFRNGDEYYPRVVLLEAAGIIASRSLYDILGSQIPAVPTSEPTISHVPEKEFEIFLKTLQKPPHLSRKSQLPKRKALTDSQPTLPKELPKSDIPEDSQNFAMLIMRERVKFAEMFDKNPPRVEGLDSKCCAHPSILVSSLRNKSFLDCMQHLKESDAMFVDAMMMRTCFEVLLGMHLQSNTSMFNAFEWCANECAQLNFAEDHFLRSEAIVLSSLFEKLLHHVNSESMPCPEDQTTDEEENPMEDSVAVPSMSDTHNESTSQEST